MQKEISLHEKWVNGKGQTNTKEATMMLKCLPIKALSESLSAIIAVFLILRIFYMLCLFFFNWQTIVPVKIWTLICSAAYLFFFTHLMACILQDRGTAGELAGVILPLKTRNVAAKMFQSRLTTPIKQGIVIAAPKSKLPFFPHIHTYSKHSCLLRVASGIELIQSIAFSGDRSWVQCRRATHLQCKWDPKRVSRMQMHSTREPWQMYSVLKPGSSTNNTNLTGSTQGPGATLPWGHTGL